jgi:hypothetical protein
VNRSSARFLSYDMRPAKQAERLMLIDYLRCSAECGIKLADYRYVGMGGNRFYDFLLLHRFIGIKKMVSLEHDDGMYLRSKFNKPFDFVQIANESVEDFLAADNYQDPSIFWLDFDGGISQQIIADVQSLGVIAKPNSFFFITVLGEYQKFLNDMNDSDRLKWLQAELGDVGQNLTQENVQKSQSHNAIFKCVSAALSSAFAFRGDGSFYPQFSVRYADSTKMVTTGGFFGDLGKASEIVQRRNTCLPNLNASEQELFQLRNFNITERERSLLNVASTAKDRRKKEWRKLLELGFKDPEIIAYGDMLRFNPRYIESIL